MSKNTFKKRKVREKKLRKQKNIDRTNRLYNEKYPKLYVSSDYADVEFVNAVRFFVSKIDFRDFPSWMKCLYHDLKVLDEKEILKKHSDRINYFLDKSKDNDDKDEYLKQIRKSVYIGQIYCMMEYFIWNMIYKYLKDNGMWDKFTPENHIFVTFYRGDIKVCVNSFHSHRNSFGLGYYPENAPKIEIRGKEYILAVSLHAVKRMHSRIGGVSSQDLMAPYGMYSLMTYADFTPIQLTNGSDAVKIEISYNRSEQSTIFSYAYKLAFEIYGDIPNKFKFLCGYSPIGFCSDDFIHLKTFLEPGMLGTPERVLFKTVSYKDSIYYKDLLQNSSISEEYTEMRKFFQENDCLQITVC